MIRYAQRTLCPSCGTPLASPSRACPGCALPLLDPLAGQVFATLTRADHLMDEWRAKIPQAATVPTGTPAPADVTPEADPTAVTPGPGSAPVPPIWVPQVSAAPTSSGPTVPQLLLGLGALCLMVAAGAFLALTWASMSLGARTSVLIAFTAVAAGASWFSQGRRLRGSAEAGFSVFAALLAFDLTGAFDAGWFGRVDVSNQVTVIGTVVGLAALAWSFATQARHGGSLTAPQVVAPLGFLLASLGASVDLPTGPTLAVGTMALAGLAMLGRLRAWVPLRVCSLVAGGFLLVATVVSALADLTASSSLSIAWVDGRAWSGLFLAAAVVLATRSVWPTSTRALMLGLGTAAALVVATALAPLSDENHDVQLAVLSALLVASAVSWQFLPQRRGALAGVTASIATAAAAPFAALWLLAGVDHMVPGGEMFGYRADWSRGALEMGFSAWWLPILVAATGATVTVAFMRSTWASRSQFLPALGWVLLAVAAALPVVSGILGAPLVAVVIGELVVAAVAGAWSLRSSSLPPLGAAAALALLALLLAQPNAWLTLATLLAWVVPATALSALRPGMVRQVAGAVAVVSGALATLTILWLTPLAQEWWMFVLAAVLGVVVLAVPRGWVEAPAVALLLPTIGLSLIDTDVAALLDRCAMILTLLGGLIVAQGLLHRSRRWSLPVGGVLLIGATWCRLLSLGVSDVEWYTMPTAVVLIALGVWRMRTATAPDTRTLLTPGLSLATVPSLLVIWSTEVTSLRGLLLAVGCVALLLIGSALRWASPLMVGGAVGLCLALQASAPVISALPIWIVAAIAGTLLVAVGVTWEARIRDLRTIRFRFHEMA